MDRKLIVALSLCWLVASCDSGKSFTLSKNKKLCFTPVQTIVATSQKDSLREVTFSTPTKSFEGNIYVHISSRNYLKGSAFLNDLNLLIQKNQKRNEVDFGVAVVSDNSVGVYHYFDNNSVLSTESYRGSCFTLSEKVGECTFYLPNSEQNIKIDFPYGNLSQWQMILSDASEQISNLYC